MKKKILGLTLAAISLTAFSSMAQSSASDNTSDRQTRTCIVKEECRKGDKVRCDLFEGLTLTETQKSQLQQLNQQVRADRQQKKEARKAEKQRVDSAKVAQRRADKKEYLEQVKAIIGPDQYVVFLENYYVNSGQGHPKAFRQGHKDFKAGKAGKRGDKKDRKDGNHRHHAAKGGKAAKASKS